MTKVYVVMIITKINSSHNWFKIAELKPRVCSYCKKLMGTWEDGIKPIGVKSKIFDESTATHGICIPCFIKETIEHYESQGLKVIEIIEKLNEEANDHKRPAQERAEIEREIIKYANSKGIRVKESPISGETPPELGPPGKPLIDSDTEERKKKHKEFLEELKKRQQQGKIPPENPKQSQNSKKIKLSRSQWEFIGKKTGWIKSAQNLENVKTPEPLNDRELTRAIRDAIIAEEGAIKQYETVADAAKDKKVKETLQDISNEEKVHVFELQKLLEILLPDEKKFLEKGEQEVIDVVKEK